MGEWMTPTEALSLLRDLWSALGCAHNPDDFKPSVQAVMRADALKMVREQTAGVTRIHRENQALVAEVRARDTVIEAVRAIEVADRVDHSGHVGEDGEPCGAPVSWKSRMGRDLARALEGATDE
jgi:hypothetical protein